MNFNVTGYMKGSWDSISNLDVKGYFSSSVENVKSNLAKFGETVCTFSGEENCKALVGRVCENRWIIGGTLAAMTVAGAAIYVQSKTQAISADLTDIKFTEFTDEELDTRFAQPIESVEITAPRLSSLGLVISKVSAFSASIKAGFVSVCTAISTSITSFFARFFKPKAEV